MEVDKVLALIVVTILYPIMANNLASIGNNTMDDVLINVQYKLDKFTTKLSQMDTLLQGLQEKSNTWEIFRHHIDAWNGQMQALEHKLEAIQRLQSTKGERGDRGISLEFTLDQILTKVVLMTDFCQSYNDNKAEKKNIQELELVNERVSLIQAYEKATGDFKKAQLDAIARMNNILRFVHNLDYKLFSEVKKKKLNKQFDLIKNANLQKPSFENECVTKNLKNSTSNNLITLTNVTRDVKHLNEQTKKNTKKLDSLTKTLAVIEEKLSVWHANAENNVNYMTKQCQSASKELSNFSESSDLLLKRIEFLVHDVGKKLNSIDWNINESINKKNKKSDADLEKVEREQEEEIEFDISKKKMPTGHEEGFSIFNVEDTGNYTNALDFIQTYKTGCHELSEDQRIDGIYHFQSPLINKAGRDFNERLCVFGEIGPAWTVIQNRGPYVEQENFNRSWYDYSSGFGDISKDFWFGNNFIHMLVYQNDYELRIEMENFDNEVLYAEYKIFRIENETFKYNLLIEGYQGTAGDALTYHNNMDFSAYDRRNDRSVDACALIYGSGWWFNNCSKANLNGIYQKTPAGHNYLGIIWELWHEDYSFYKVRMMIRPKGVKELFTSTEELNGDP